LTNKSGIRTLLINFWTVSNTDRKIFKKGQINAKNSATLFRDGTYSPWTCDPQRPKVRRSMKKKNAIQRETFLKKVGQNIREARMDRDMSQESLALAADLDRSYVGSVERGERNIAIVNLKKIADALNMPLSDLLTTKQK